MRYNKQKLLQMTSDELLSVAAEFGIADAQALDTQTLVNTIVGAQADQALGAYQAREDALQPKRRTRVVLSSPAAGAIPAAVARWCAQSTKGYGAIHSAKRSAQSC